MTQPYIYHDGERLRALIEPTKPVLQEYNGKFSYEIATPMIFGDGGRSVVKCDERTAMHKLCPDEYKPGRVFESECIRCGGMTKHDWAIVACPAKCTRGRLTYRIDSLDKLVKWQDLKLQREKVGIDCDLDTRLIVASISEVTKPMNDRIAERGQLRIGKNGAW